MTKKKDSTAKRKKGLGGTGNIGRTLSSLTEQQNRYVDLYFEYAFNKKKAAIDAGYSPNGIDTVLYRLDHHEGVQAEIERREVLIRRGKIKKLSDIIKDLERNADEAYEAGKFSDSNRALELLGKLQGAFKDKVEIDAHVKKEEVVPSDMMDDILDSLFEKASIAEEDDDISGEE